MPLPEWPGGSSAGSVQLQPSSSFPSCSFPVSALFSQLKRWRSESSLHSHLFPGEGTRAVPARVLRQSLLPPLLASPECCWLPCAGAHCAVSFLNRLRPGRFYPLHSAPDSAGRACRDACPLAPDGRGPAWRQAGAPSAVVVRARW